MTRTICITEKEYDKAKAFFEGLENYKCLRCPTDEAPLAREIQKHRAWAAVLGVEPYRNELYDALPKGGAIVRFGVGHDGVDKTLATQKGLFVVNTPGVLDASVAEHAVGLMCALARGIARQAGQCKAGNWSPAMGTELGGQTLLIYGCGAIGRRTARIAHFGFGMNVVGFDPAPLDHGQLKLDYGIRTLYTDPTEALAAADFISVHVPAIPETRHVVNAEFLAKMKPHACLINTARGYVLDENALFDALKNNRIAGAALDVFEYEPYRPVDSARDLRTLENLLMTPHVGSSTQQACLRIARVCIDSLTALDEKRYDNVSLLNRDILETLS